VTSELAVAEPKTKLLVEKLTALSLQSALIVVEAHDEKLALAARNLPHVDVLTVSEINPVSLLSFDKVLMTVGAVKLIEERLQ
jgi:large subunit ribosomal protein L4